MQIGYCNLDEEWLSVCIVQAEEVAAIDADGDQGEGTPPWVVLDLQV